MNFKSIFSILFLLFTFNSISSEVQVRILSTKNISSFIFSPTAGNFKIFGNEKHITVADASGIFQMLIEGDFIILKTFEQTLGRYSQIEIRPDDKSCSFKIKSVAPDGKVRHYQGGIKVQLAQDKKQFLLINYLDIEDYIAGVVESESGKNARPEYYKVQSILCRTYLLANLNKHVAEGYEVCDDVHCQAYLSKASYSPIKAAVESTINLVVVDSDLNLITAAFHSNCGGQTCNSQDVWSVATSYLKGVRDTFCLSQPHARWKRSINAEDWKSYLQLRHNYPINDSVLYKMATDFVQQTDRLIYFPGKNINIPLKNIRADFQLKSTFFSISKKGDSVEFLGRGYGHGVGMCQEGAMRQAFLNRTYKDILTFYYKDVHIVDLNALSFYRQE